MKTTEQLRPPGRPASAPARTSHPLRTTIVDIVAPVAVYYGARALGASIWAALIAGGILIRPAYFTDTAPE